jgi:ComF family protein
MRASVIFEKLKNLLFPPKCLLCSDATSENKSELCDNCLDRWKALREVRCPKCGNTASGCRCGSKQLGKAAYCGALFFYDSRESELKDGRRIIYSLKRSSDRRYARFLAREMAAMLLRYAAAHGIDLSHGIVTNAPRSRSAVREYGFDQGEILARYTAQYIGARYSRMLINIGGKAQKNLSASERRNNAEGSIVLKGIIEPGALIILVDDVITTGATLGRCAELLRCGGAENVICAAAASTRSRRSSTDARDAVHGDGELWFKN